MSSDQYKRRPEDVKLALDYNVDFTIDLLGIEGGGDFPCPGCGATMSPEDKTEGKTEDKYAIVDTIMDGENLKYLVIKCNACQKNIRLEGFKVLSSQYADRQA